MNDREFIKQFQKITVSNVCRETSVNYYNIASCRAGIGSTKKVADAIEKKLEKLLEEKQSSSKNIMELLNETNDDIIDRVLDKLYCWGEALDPQFQQEMIEIIKGENAKNE